MKRGKLPTLALGIALITALSLPGFAFAAEKQDAVPGKAGFSSLYQRGNQGVGFVDADGDGICDNYQNNGTGNHYLNSVRGVYCTYNSGNAVNDCINAPQGAQHQDANNNGICDNRENGVGNGTGSDHGAGTDSGHNGGAGGGHGGGNGHGGGH